MLDSDDSSDDDEVDEENIDEKLNAPNQSSTIDPLSTSMKFSSSASSKDSASSASVSNDYCDIPSEEFDFNFDSFSKALEAMMSKNNQSSSGFPTDDDSFQDSDDEDDVDDDFLIGDDDDDEGIETIKNYMREMDRELSKTEMGKSFVRKENITK